MQLEAQHRLSGQAEQCHSDGGESDLRSGSCCDHSTTFFTLAGMSFPARGMVSPHFLETQTMKLPRTITFNGTVYEVPSMEQIGEWVIDSVCETPEGDIVEPDHPDSWLSLLGLI